MAQAEIAALLKAESQILAGGQAPTHAHTMRWLEAIGERFAPEARAFARLRGLDTMDPQALLIPEEEPAEASR